MKQTLILGSSSPFRAELLQKLGLPFIQVSPSIDEQSLDGESPEVLVERLARQKAQKIAETHAEALIIGSDQVAVIDGVVLGKPGGYQKALEQLQFAAGKKVTFYTGLALLNAKTGNLQSLVEPFHVHFRELTMAQIAFYVTREQPYQCAGSFKSEGFGISLFKALEGRDPNSLIGLPLISLIELMNIEGIDVLNP